VPERLGASRTLRHSVDTVPRHFACSYLEPSTSSASRFFCHTRAPSDTRKARANAAEKEWFKEHGTKLDWIKHKADGRWSEEPSDSNSEPQPLVGRWLFWLINQDFFQSTTYCEFSLMEKAILSLFATCRPLGSAATLPAFRGNKRLHT
jgi:hypothetical protein